MVRKLRRPTIPKLNLRQPNENPNLARETARKWEEDLQNEIVDKQRYIDALNQELEYNQTIEQEVVELRRTISTLSERPKKAAPDIDQMKQEAENLLKDIQLLRQDELEVELDQLTLITEDVPVDIVDLDALTAIVEEIEDVEKGIEVPEVPKKVEVPKKGTIPPPRAMRRSIPIKPVKSLLSQKGRSIPPTNLKKPHQDPKLLEIRKRAEKLKELRNSRK